MMSVVTARAASLRSPSTITGSIGVVGGKLAMTGLFNKVGITTETIERGKNSGIFSSNSKFSDSEREAITANMQDVYRLFTAKAAAGRHLPLVCTLNATRVSDATARLLGIDHAVLDELALAASPGAGGLVLVPYFDGERTPNRPDATGAMTGLRSDITREQLARAAIEGVVCGLLDGLDALAAAGVPTSGRLLLVGGGARSRAYREILSALSGRALYVPDAAEHVAAGACAQAAAVLHGRPPDVVAAHWALGAGSVVEPADIDRDVIRARYADARG